MSSSEAESTTTATKRKLDAEFNDSSSSTTSPPKRDSSQHAKMSKLEHHLLEGEMKANLVKLITLEQQLTGERLERQKLEQEFSMYKEKQSYESKLLQEQKNQLEQSLKSAKLNEKLINGEMEHLRKTTEKYEKQTLPDKDKEIDKLKHEIKNLKEEAKSAKVDLEAENIKLKFDLTSKISEISQLEQDIRSLNETIRSNKEALAKLEETNKENSSLRNSLRDAEFELTRLKEEDGSKLVKFMDQSNRINELEREKRALKTEVDYLKATQEKSHLFKEELESKKKLIERHEKKMIELELEKTTLQDEIKLLKQKIESQSASNSGEGFKQVISELKSELSKTKDKLKELNEERKQLKSDLKSKEDDIIEIQKRLTRTVSERNGYKKIIEMDDESKHSPDAETRLLRKRIEELEIILSTYKKTLKESDEIKTDVKCVEVQVNLNAEIYSEYERQIHQLKAALEKTSKPEPDMSNETTINDEKENYNKALEFKLNEQIKLTQLVKTEFSRKAKEISRKLNALFGDFKVSFEDENVKLTQVSNPNNFLIFQSKKNGSLSLHESDYLNACSNLIDAYLKGFNTYLIFLAAIYCEQNGLSMEIKEQKSTNI